MLRAAIQKGGVDVVAVNDPFLDVDYMVSAHMHPSCQLVCNHPIHYLLDSCPELDAMSE